MSKKYNHMLDLTFTVISKTEEGSDITAAQIQKGILKRLIALVDEGGWEIGMATMIVETHLMGD